MSIEQLTAKRTRIVPHSIKESLPTMYDLPSENPEDPGMPDQFHPIQAELLSNTFHPDYPPEEMLIGTDLHLYFDLDHQNWYKRPDWFVVLGVPHLYDNDLRMSYVMWQEKVAPYLVVELLSPSTKNEDLGKTKRRRNQPPTKWKVYEQILRVPYYVLFSRHTNELKAYQLIGKRYRELILSEKRLWLPEIKLGLRVWKGRYNLMERKWLLPHHKSFDKLPLVVNYKFTKGRK
ncbi:Uma2 family endonuclease [Anaerolineales bacterium HSG24]|nr:Uma2 family endonuclease [Anaerolineales bacterium HSG24]